MRRILVTVLLVLLGSAPMTTRAPRRQPRCGDRGGPAGQAGRRGAATPCRLPASRSTSSDRPDPIAASVSRSVGTTRGDTAGARPRRTERSLRPGGVFATEDAALHAAEAVMRASADAALVDRTAG